MMAGRHDTWINKEERSEVFVGGRKGKEFAGRRAIYMCKVPSSRGFLK